MRLLHTDTAIIKFSHRWDDEIQEYAILSHTWYDNESEVSFQDMDKSESKALAGYHKILKCCSLAQSQGYEYVWIDTCCIDKTSSAELSEAINSMFRWYERATVCYVYLADVSSSNLDWRSEFHNSKWFRRGWTLQELLAPYKMIFYDCEWKELGSKDTLRSEISSATGIEWNHLVNPRDASTAQKMSWVSNRETTRTEDQSYCLLGLFDINMTPIYGEASKAFIRLQQKIAKKTDDESLFAWNDPDSGLPNTFTGMFAESPKFFAKSGNIVPVSLPLPYRPPWSVTNRGLAISLYVNAALNKDIGGSSEVSRFELALLNCARDTSDNIPLCIRLVRLSRDELARPALGEIPLEGSQLSKYLSTINGKEDSSPEALSLEPRQVYIRPKLAHDRIDSYELLPRFNIQTFLFSQKSRKSGLQILDFYCSHPSLTLYDPQNWDLALDEGYAGFMFSQVNSKQTERFLLIIRLGRTEASMDIVRKGCKGRPPRNPKVSQMYGDPEAWPDTKARYFEGFLQSKRKLSVALRQGDGPGEQHCYVNMQVFEKDKY